MMMSGGRGNSRYPFTPSQWQELEHQALIFKYMAAGIPIPSDLIVPIRRSFFLDSTSAFPPQPPLGWSCFPMGFGRKAEDPEPGRCRRTDGKKWRCSKEAYPDSKYCERHMHRGKNRSRKPVEISLTPTLNSSSINNLANIAATATTTTTTANPPPLSMSASPHDPYHHLLYSRPLAGDYSRYCHHGMRDVDEYTFFSEGSRGERESSWQFKPLGMSSLSEPKQSSWGEEEKEKHCFVLGADFKLGRPLKEEGETGDGQKPLRHFFDEWPQKSKEGWMGLEGEGSSQQGSYSKTQLSISIPMGLHDFHH